MIKHTVNDNIKGNLGTFTFTWHKTKNFSNISPITQAYGVCFDKQGRIAIVKIRNKKFPEGRWMLPGGTPEGNETPEETLIREVEEEADLELENIQPIGYQEVHHHETGDITSHLRYFALIGKINSPTPDPDTGKIHERKFIKPKDFSKYCNWGPVGEKIIEEGVKLFERIN